MIKYMLLTAAAVLSLTACGETQSDPAAARQARATSTAMNAADQEVGMPRIKNFAQRKLLKNAYEDMDQTTLTYVYTQALDGKFVCLGQAVGYGVSMGTQFTAGSYPQWIGGSEKDDVSRGTYMIDQPEPNGLYSPSSGEATIVNLVGQDGVAHTAIMEPRIVTTPGKLPASAVSVQCPGDIDPSKVHDAKETSVVKQHD